jgi:hypothetical protein
MMYGMVVVHIDNKARIGMDVIIFIIVVKFSLRKGQQLVDRFILSIDM